MDYRILGRLEVRDEDRDVTPARGKTRALLALLLLNANQRVATDRIIEELWGEAPPATADKALHGHVSALRKLLGSERIRTEMGGYRLEVEADELDADRFSSAVDSARKVDSPTERARLLADALGMWRGEPLAALGDERFAQAEVARLQSLRLLAEEDRIDAELALGRHAEAIPELQRLVAANPMSEGLRASLMRALYRAGRQSDALRVYREGRRLLAEELGIEPGAELQLLERQVLSQDPALDPPAAASPADTASGAAPRQERKTVTVLVVELAAAPGADPEDLARLAAPGLDRIRAAIGGAGGRAEPIFADAVLGIFGAPRAHDDDPLRAVRVALDLLGADGAGGLRVRVGIETGEALVTIDGADVAVTGQVLGAASRLQATAAPGTIIVGPATHRATADAIDYAEVDGVSWAPRGLRLGDAAARPESPFVGRSGELGQLERIFARARDGRSPQLVTITAEPGGGKSRLLRELRDRLEAAPEGGPVAAEPPRWLQGRCLPYGNGLTFWALGAIVREWAGILESDAATASAAKLERAIATLDPDVDRRAWLARSAGALVGIDDGAAPADRLQGFSAWRQLIEGIAAERSLVVAFEDIHWADDAMLAFIDHLVEHTTGVPLLVLCTARPELLDARPTWGAGKRNAATILLEPLGDTDAGALLGALLGRTAEPDTIRRAGGNPLYAHELARHLLDPSVEAGPIPGSLQAVIAAHLDALTPELKVVAADAAVVGEVFWPGLVADIGGADRTTVAAHLHRLVANEVVRRRLRSTVAGQDEYEFLHVLVRDVAYGQIPRRDRIDKHRAAAEWIEQLAHGRPTAHAELVAHHYLEALGLAEGLADARVPELRSGAVAALARAGDGVRALDVAKATVHYRRALELMAEEDPDRGALIARLGEAAGLAGDLEEAERLNREAIAALLAVGDERAAAAAMVTLESVGWRLGRAEGGRRTLLDEAIRLLEPLPPSPELVRAYAQLAAHELYDGSAAACLAWSSRALAVADVLGDPALRFQPRHYIGIARFEQGDGRGIDDVRAAIDLGLEAGMSWETGHAQADLGAMVWLQDGPRRAIPLKSVAAAFAEERGMTALAETTRAQMLWMQYDAGEWDELLEIAARLAAAPADHQGRVTMMARSATARVLVGRGRLAEALPLEADVVARGRAIGDAQDLDPSLATAAYVRSAAGDAPGALGFIAEMEELSRGQDLSRRAHDLALVARICVAHGAPQLAASFIPRRRTPGPTRARLAVATTRAIVAEAAGDVGAAGRAYAAVADGWARYGFLEEEAHALLGHARSLATGGRPADPAGISRALRIGRDLGAITIVEEANRLLEGSRTGTSA